MVISKLFDQGIELLIIEERIQDKTEQTKIKMDKAMDKAMQRAETDRLWPIIETLRWTLNEILELNRLKDQYS